MNTRNHKFFPQLTGLRLKLEEKIEQFSTTDRGLMGIAARDAEDVRNRMDKRAAKMARRAARAKGNG